MKIQFDKPYHDTEETPDFSRPIYLFSKDKKGYREVWRIEPEAWSDELDPKIAWFELVEQKKAWGWSYYPYPGTSWR